MALLTSRSALHAVGIELDRRYENAGCLCRLSVHHQAGSREMSVWRAKVRGTLAVTGGNEEGRMQKFGSKPPRGHPQAIW
jgi:hypothetical protein